jgi:predicted RNA-binding Zn-ribbon protein involved in translation (DUF1610 family)
MTTLVKHRCSCCMSTWYLPEDTPSRFICPDCGDGELVRCNEPDPWEKVYPNTLPNLWVWHANTHN